MNSVAIEVADAGLVALGGGELAGRRLPAPSPGLAVQDGGTLRVGVDAARIERLKPRHAHDRFWDELATTPAGAPFAAELSLADLAHAHLQAVRMALVGGLGAEELRSRRSPHGTGDGLRPASEPVETFLAVPGWFTEAQLGLLLGIARAAGLPAAGLVDAAVAAAAAAPREGVALHVDVSLHRTTLTALRIDAAVARDQIDVTRRGGLAGLHETFARGIAAAFVRETRFDPLHRAESEQALYDRLPGWLDALRTRESTTARLEAGGRGHEVPLTRARLEAWAEPLAAALARRAAELAPGSGAFTFLLSARAASVPGLAARLGQVPGASVVELPAEAAAAGALRLRDQLRGSGEALPFVTRLQTRGGDDHMATARVAVAAGARGTEARAGARPTHLLAGDVAHALGTEPLVLGSAPPAGCRAVALVGAGVAAQHARVWLDGDGEAIVETVDATAVIQVGGVAVAVDAVLRSGDRLRLGDVELLLIRVDGGAA
ncbi:MAG: FHA domain-containing protein [Vicinamibacteria bacterium]|nr:FHA domain-containing protein [Vicinamibacteria bacterium]